MKDMVMSGLAFLLMATYIKLMDFNEWRATRKGYLCRDCGQIIMRGTGVIIEGKDYFYCSSCIRRKI